MRFFCILVLLFTISVPALAKDQIRQGDTVMTGRITAFVDGVINFRKKGMEYTLQKTRQPDYFGDYIEYRDNPFKKHKVQTMCRLVYVDMFQVIFETKTDRVKIPRYRVSSLIINAN